MARPGLEPGTPRFRGRRVEPFLDAKSLQNELFERGGRPPEKSAICGFSHAIEEMSGRHLLFRRVR
jgi:hypothetical protein